MDPTERQRITLNQQYLCQNISEVESVMDKLIENNIMTIDECERIRYERSTSDKIKRLLRILMKHPKGYCGLQQALNAVKMEFIAQTLESTCINEDKLLKGKIYLIKRSHHLDLSTYICPA